MIKEVRKKVYDIVDGYDQIHNKSAACAFCEKRCMYYNAVEQLIKGHVAVGKVLERWEKNDYLPSGLQAFLESSLVRTEHSKDIFEMMCIIGYVLNQNPQLSNGARKKILAQFLKFKYKERENGGTSN